MPDAPPEPEVEAPRVEKAGRHVSAVWLVPLLALVVALGVAWRTYSERGPLIEIVLEDAAGIEAGETTLRFRDVTVGTVEKLELTPDLKRVVATARIEKDLAHFVDSDAQFWVVRPSVTAQGVSGIETVISGVYIEAFWDDKSDGRQDRFEALPRAPLTPGDQPGLRVRLRAPDGGSLSIGAPVLFKSIEVGKVENVSLTDAGDVMIDLFINAPYHLRVTEGTRFWNASGFSIELGATGASLNVESLVSLLQGGVSFDTVGSDVTAATENEVFALYDSESAARQNLVADGPGERLLVDTTFEGSVQGLQPGAPVELLGIRIGEVSSLQAAVEPGEDDGPEVTLRATLSIVPARLGIGDDVDNPADAALDILDREVRTGVRAQLTSAGLLQQSLRVSLVKTPNDQPAQLERDADPYPMLPSIPSEPSGIAQTAEGVMQRIQALPIEEILDNVVTLLANVNSLVTDENVRAAPANLGLLIADLRETIVDSDFKEVPAQVTALLASAREVVDQAAEARLVDRVTEVLDATRTSIASVGSAAEGVPALLQQVEALAGDARELPLDELVTSGAQLVDDIDAFVKSDQLTGIPASLDASLAELRGLIAALRDGGAVENVNATLASVRQISGELAEARLAESVQSVVAETRRAAENFGTASEGLPDLMERMNALSDRIAALQIEDVVASADELIGTTDTLLSSEGVAELPVRLSAALEELRAILAELREGGAAENVNATLASASDAADALTAAAAGLPALIDELSRVADRADSAIAAYGPGSEVNRDTLALLQELSETSRSVRSLVSALERRPNSVLFGR